MVPRRDMGLFLRGYGGAGVGVAVITKTHPGFVGVTPVAQTVSTTGTRNGHVSCHLMCAKMRGSGDLSTSLFTSLRVGTPSTCLKMGNGGPARLATKVVVTFRHRLARGPARMILIISSLATAVDYTVMTGGRGVGMTRLMTNAHSFSVSVPGRVGHVVASNLSSCLFATNVMTGHGLGRANARGRAICCMKGVLVSAVHCGHGQLVGPM